MMEEQQYLSKESFLCQVAEVEKWLELEDSEGTHLKLLGQIYEYDNGVEKPRKDAEIPLYLFRTAEWVRKTYKKYTGKKLVKVLEAAGPILTTALTIGGELLKYIEPISGTVMQCSSPVPTLGALGYRARLKAKFEDEQPLASEAKRMGMADYCDKVGTTMTYKLLKEATGYHDVLESPHAS